MMRILFPLICVLVGSLTGCATNLAVEECDIRCAFDRNRLKEEQVARERRLGQIQSRTDEINDAISTLKVKEERLLVEERRLKTTLFKQSRRIDELRVLLEQARTDSRIKIEEYQFLSGELLRISGLITDYSSRRHYTLNEVLEVGVFADTALQAVTEEFVKLNIHDQKNVELF